MRVQNNNGFTPVFGTLYPDADGISNELFQKVIKTPPVKKFAKHFDGSLGIDHFISSTDIQRTQKALYIENIEPKNIFIRLIRFLSGKKYNAIMLKTKAVNEDELVAELNSFDKNSLIKIYMNK